MSKFICVLAFLMAFCFNPHLGFAHQGHTQQAPWEVCQGQQLGHACSWQDDHHNIYEGTCRQIKSSLMCVRNRPIRKASTSASSKTGPRTAPHVSKAPLTRRLEIAWAIPIALMVLSGFLVGIPYVRRRS